MSTIQQTKNQNQEVQQLSQRIWVKEQETNALKVQNRHLIAQLEEAEKNTKPTEKWAQQISNEVQNYLKPVVNEIQQQSQIAQVQIEKSLTQAFEMIQGTLRGVYQQSQRCQESVNQLSSHSADLERKVHEQRKADQIFFQEKIFASMQAFCDRIERQLEGRLSILSTVEVMNIKVNEMLTDIQSMKNATTSMSKNAELNRQDFTRMGRDGIENHQKLTEIEIQARNVEEISRDALQQIQNHRTEFKILRGEMRAVLEQSQRLTERFNQIELAVQNGATQSTMNEIKEIIASDQIQTIQNDSDVVKMDSKNDDLGVILGLLRNQKNELKKAAKEAESYLKSVNVNHQDGVTLENQEVKDTNLASSVELNHSNPEANS